MRRVQITAEFFRELRQVKEEHGLEGNEAAAIVAEKLAARYAAAPDWATIIEWILTILALFLK